MGGGVELGLHCDYRTVSTAVPAFALPEVLPRPGARLGRHPAAAEPDRRGQRRHGDHRERAEPEPDAQAASRPSSSASPTRCSRRADFLEQSLVWAASVLNGRRSRSSAPRSTAARPGTRRARPRPGHRRRQGARRGPGPVPGARAHRAGPDGDLRREGFAAEDEALADLIMGDELRAGLYAFDLVQKRGQAAGRRAGQGAGPPGHQGRRRRRRSDGLAARAAVRPPARGAGRDDRPRPGARRQGRRLRPRRDRQAARQGPDQPGQGQPAQGAGHRVAGQGEAFADADFVIEAVFEEMSVKQQVFAEVEAVVSGECVLATNTSSLSVTEMAVEAGAPGAGRRLPLLQPGRGAAAAGDRPRRADRRRLAGHRVRGRQEAEEDRVLVEGRPGVRREPAS